MRNNAICPEGRQHINISQYAYDIIQNDSLNFEEEINYSGFINRIILNMMGSSFDDIVEDEKERIRHELTEYSKPGRKISLSESEEQTVERISKAHRNYRIAANTHEPKDRTLKIRLRNKVYERLYPQYEEWQGAHYNITQGEYIKSILEEYARKTIYEREKIYYKDLIKTINDCINRSDKDKHPLVITQPSGKKFCLKPYRISEDYEADYHYIIGMSREFGKSEYTPASFRLSRIKEEITEISGSGKITEKEKKILIQKTKTNGVSYLLGELEQHIVRLTPAGMIIYNSIFHNRPVYDSKTKLPDGSFELVFNVTKRQITNYFFTFGKEAFITEPGSTAEEMQLRYKEALDSYDNGLG